MQNLEKLVEQAQVDVDQSKDLDALEAARVKYLGKKGLLTDQLKGLKDLPPAERKEVGAKANKLKSSLTEHIETKKITLLDQQSPLEHPLDVTQPGNAVAKGGLHPITQMCYDLDDAFASLNFELHSGPEVTSELFEFDHLNFPPDHPARESMDTYWLSGSENKTAGERLCLRPHLTGASVRYMQTHKPPFRFVYPGKVYRNESTDARHERAFTQYEALIIDKDIPFSAGQVMINTVLNTVFGIEVPTRMRVGFFPFVEPGFEIDMQCQVCKGEGCSVCKHVGWLEIMPGGAPHPNVLRAGGIDPNEWTGFYVNIGLDRLVMMRYAIEDVRRFHSGDLRFLQQFK